MALMGASTGRMIFCPARGRGTGFRVQGTGFRVQGSGCRVQGAGFRDQDSDDHIQLSRRTNALQKYAVVLGWDNKENKKTSRWAPPRAG